MPEMWRPVVGYEDAYEVSSLGRIRTIARIVKAGDRGGVRSVPAAIRAPSLGNNGYLQVTLRRRTHMIHTLVTAAFLGPRPTGMEVCHNNGDAHDNRAENLRYDTISANRRDTVLHGRNPMTQRTHCPQGHPYDEVNTGRTTPGARRCLTCHRERQKARYHARKVPA